MEMMGYLRRNGKKGIRNLLVVASTVACSNSVARRVAQITDTVVINHESGCMDPTEKINRTRLILKRIAEHPNVGAIVFIGLGCENIDAEEIAKELEVTADKPIGWVRIQDEGGTTKTIEKAVDIVNKFETILDTQKRVPMDPSELCIGVQCGGSDWTSALAGNTSIGYVVDKLIDNGGTVLYGRIEGIIGSERVLASRSACPEVGKSIMEMVMRLKEDFYLENGQYIEDINPTPGNKAGGITTLLEKSVGNIKKSGTCPITGIIRFGEQIPDRGMWFLDAKIPGPDIYGLSAYAIHGCHLTIFSSGLGNPIGCAIIPALKLTGNAETFQKLEENFDFDASPIIRGVSIEKVGVDLYNLMIKIVNGQLTRAELLDFQEFGFPY